jgi:hypothetical protein
MSTAKAYLCVLAIFVLTGCGGSPTEPSDYEFGRADVYVLDTTGQPINGVALRLVRPGGQVEDAGGATGSVGLPGYYFFLKAGGDFRIEITSTPGGYEFAPGMSPTIPITFTRNQTQRINVVLQRG